MTGRVRNVLRQCVQGLCFAKYVIFHPFKGFWELKRERRGNMWAASLILLGLVIVLIARRQFTGPIVNDNDPLTMNLLLQFTYVLLPFILWCCANWAVTTLMDGEGSFRDIFITSAYALVPTVIINVPMVILSNVFIEQEMTFYYLLDVVSFIWTGYLIIIGLMTVHQFTIPKTLGTICLAIVGMAAIMVLVLSFFTMYQQIVNFVKITYFELFQR